MCYEARLLLGRTRRIVHGKKLEWRHHDGLHLHCVETRWTLHLCSQCPGPDQSEVHVEKGLRQFGDVRRGIRRNWANVVAALSHQDPGKYQSSRRIWRRL